MSATSLTPPSTGFSGILSTLQSLIMKEQKKNNNTEMKSGTLFFIITPMNLKILFFTVTFLEGLASNCNYVTIISLLNIEFHFIFSLTCYFFYSNVLISCGIYLNFKYLFLIIAHMVYDKIHNSNIHLCLFKSE